MKKITLLGSICLVVILAVMLFGACAQPAQTPVTVTAPALTVTSPPVTVTATKETIYSVLDPRSHEPPRKYQGLTPRLTTLEGKKIIVVNLRGGNEEAILSVGPALQKAIPTAKVTTYTLQEAMVSAKEWDMFKTYDAAIFGHSY